MPAGRPSGYKPEYVEQVTKLCLLGATDMQIADFFEVSERTLNRWKLDYPEFCQSLKIAKEEADSAVERSLYRKALGYEFESEKVFCDKGEIVRTPIREIVPPSDTAIIFWLKNRKSKQWRDKAEVEHSGGVSLVTDIPRPK